MVEGTTEQDAAKCRYGWAMAWGILLLVLGAVAIAAPFLAALWATVMAGWLILVGGVIQSVHAFQTMKEKGFVWKLLVGILYGLAGLWLLAEPLQGVLTLTLALAIILLAGGISHAVMSFSIRPARGWGWYLFDAVVSILLGIFIMAKWPFDAPWVLGTYFGIAVLFKGFSISSFACATRHAG